MYGVSNDVADKLLMETLPKANGIKPQYVHSGMKHGLSLPPDTDDPRPRAREGHRSLLPWRGARRDAEGLSGHHGGAGPRRRAAGSRRRSPSRPTSARPISGVLQSRMLSNGLAFAAKESSIQNNLSVVLLIEWKKRRLLFVGDAEWEGEFKEGKHNGSWNVMWEKHRKTHLKAPLDFLKIGHHGSINATPPPAPSGRRRRRRRADGVYAILDTILPVPKAGAKPTAQAIVSTEREFYNPIPGVQAAGRPGAPGEQHAHLRRAPRRRRASTRNPSGRRRRRRRTSSSRRYEKDSWTQPQPLRTDLEFVTEDRPFIDIEIPPG